MRDLRQAIQQHHSSVPGRCRLRQPAPHPCSARGCGSKKGKRAVIRRHHQPLVCGNSRQDRK